ncbi:MAG: MFS transporter [Candidatus Kariarchaeaceae archaeon]|jgi:EmrB/QacA subfamily drug resistance transporter
MGDYVPLKVILPVTAIGTFMSALDASIVNIALPTIADAFSTSINGVRWVSIVYLLTISSIIGIAGSFGDVFGRKIIFQFGMSIFVIGSIFCSMAPTIEFLIVSRAIQAIGAAGLQANGLALVVTYIDPDKRGRAIGINSLVVASALTTGPALGGFLTQYYGWQSIFLINIPIGVLGVFTVQLVLKETEKKPDTRMDVKGMSLFIMTTFGLISGILFYFDGYTWMGLLIPLSIISGVMFVKQETLHPNPVLSVRIMKQRQIMFGALAAVFSYLVINAMIFLLPFYFQDVRGLSESKTGIYLVVVPLAMSVMGPPSGLLAEKINAKKLATFGAIMQFLVTFTLGAIFIIQEDGIADWIIIILIGLTSAFLAVFTNPNGTSIMNASPKSDLSSVSGIISLSRNFGFTLGITLSSLFFDKIKNSYNNETEAVAYTKSLGWTLIIISLFALTASIVSYNRGKEIIMKY